MSATTQPRLVKCPTCHQMVVWTIEQKFRPFCSERCRLIDLGEWIAEEKSIPGEEVFLETDNLTEQLWQ